MKASAGAERLLKVGLIDRFDAVGVFIEMRVAIANHDLGDVGLRSFVAHAAGHDRAA